MRVPISQETAEQYARGGNCDVWHAVKGPGLSVIEERMPPGAAEVRHYYETARPASDPAVFEAPVSRRGLPREEMA